MGEAMKLIVDYCPETDTLSLWNGKPASSGADVADNLIVDLDSDGEAVGFTLEQASKVLLPLLKNENTSLVESKSLANTRP